jgi:hypothetical protein
MTQQFVGGDMAARLIGMSYKTLKKRYDEGWITGDRTPQGKLRFTLEEVERAKKAWEEERSSFLTTSQIMGFLEPPREEVLFQDTTRKELEAEIGELKVAIAILEGRVASLEQRIAPILKPEDLDSYTFKAEGVAAKPVQSNLPEGSILGSKFAEMHGIKRSTWRHHVEDGIGPNKEKIETTNRPKPGRPHETERYLDTDLQKAAMLFWIKWRVSFSQCKNMQCECYNLK